MRPLSRHHENKHSSAKRFKGHVRHTKAANVAPPPMRGGYRL